jgi:hypothetical protein
VQNLERLIERFLAVVLSFSVSIHISSITRYTTLPAMPTLDPAARPPEFFLKKPIPVPCPVILKKTTALFAKG